MPGVKNPLTEKGKTEIVTSSFKELVNHHLFQQRDELFSVPISLWMFDSSSDLIVGKGREEIARKRNSVAWHYQFG